MISSESDEALIASVCCAADGHGGTDVAQYLSENIVATTRMHLLSSDLGSRTRVLKETLHFLDQTLTTSTASSAAQSSDSEKPFARVGSTATVALVSDRHVTLACIGDSPAFLLQHQQITQIFEPHRLDRADERERIKAAGGRVVWNPVPRVNGKLSLSRTVGYFSLRNSGVEPLAETFEHELDGSESAIVLVSDGVSDVTSPAAVASIVASSQTAREASNTLLDFSYDHGSSDNMSAIVIALPAWTRTRTATKADAIPYSLTKPSS